MFLPFDVASAAPATQMDGDGGSENAESAGFDREGLITSVVHLTNVERAKAGLPPLHANDRLGKAAQDYSSVVAPGQCFGHTCSPVPQLQDRAVAAGYTGWQRIGENIAAGQQTPENVVASWMTSPGHRDNILDPDFKEIGVGVELGSGAFGIYWVQEFGARANAY